MLKDVLQSAPPPADLDDARRRLFAAYAECFNRRDWEALAHLVCADARLEVVGGSTGRMSDLGVTSRP